MAELLAFDWDKTHPTVTLAAVSGSGVKISKVIEFAWPDSAKPEDDPAVAGDWLKVELEKHGIKTSSAVVSIPRENAVVRPLVLPNVPDSELPEMVRLQAATKSTVPLDQVKLDFLPLPSNATVEGREVLMTTVTNRLLIECRKVLAGANIELTKVGISSVAAAELVSQHAKSQQLDADSLSLVVVHAEHRLESTFLKSNRVLATHSSQTDGDQIDQIVAEINRVRFSVESNLQGNRLARVWVVGDDAQTEPLRNLLAQRMECDVRPFNVLTATGSNPKPMNVHVDRQAVLAGPVGLLSATTSPLVESVDFLNPRKPVVKKDRRKLFYGLAAAAVAVIAVAGFVMFKTTLSDYEQQIAAVNTETSEIKELLDRGEDMVEAKDIVQKWQDRNTNWLNQFTDLNQTLPGAEYMLVEKLTFSTSPNSKTHQGHVKAEGAAKTVKDLEDLNARLSAKGLAVLPQSTPEATGGSYPNPLKLDIDIPIHSASETEKSPRS